MGLKYFGNARISSSEVAYRPSGYHGRGRQDMVIGFSLGGGIVIFGFLLGMILRAPILTLILWLFALIFLFSGVQGAFANLFRDKTELIFDAHTQGFYRVNKGKKMRVLRFDEIGGIAEEREALARCYSVSRKSDRFGDGIKISDVFTAWPWRRNACQAEFAAVILPAIEQVLASRRADPVFPRKSELV